MLKVTIKDSKFAQKSMFIYHGCANLTVVFLIYCRCYSFRNKTCVPSGDVGKRNEMSPTLQLLSKIGNVDTNMLIIVNRRSR